MYSSILNLENGSMKVLSTCSVGVLFNIMKPNGFSANFHRCFIVVRSKRLFSLQLRVAFWGRETSHLESKVNSLISYFFTVLKNTAKLHVGKNWYFNFKKYSLSPEKKDNFSIFSVPWRQFYWSVSLVQSSQVIKPDGAVVTALVKEHCCFLRTERIPCSAC